MKELMKDSNVRMAFAQMHSALTGFLHQRQDRQLQKDIDAPPGDCERELPEGKRAQ